ncbi:MAG TPA: SMC-Scp complex subunit ScpB [Candidatus Baltobacteraceae bacterium]|nr:SMC-Scp complex subunit ScpB [Candidatus Baltobacteraceae bacterium]
MSVKSEIESLLFVSSRPLSVKRLADVTGHSKDEVKKALEALTAELDARAESGFILMRSGDEVQLATSPDHAAMVKDFLKDESFGELTRPALETLTIIGYRGPLTKAELEQIRGVNCSLILRNLMIRGLVETEGGKADDPTAPALYRATFDFLRYLGLRETAELPDYEHLRSDENLQKLIESQQPQAPAPAAE